MAGRSSFWEWLEALVNNDDAVKLIFDIVRNILISGAVVLAGVYLMAGAPVGLPYIRDIAGGLAVVLGCLLGLLNLIFGYEKLIKAALPKPWALVAAVIYIFVFSHLIFTVAQGRSR